jgi:hypothetical protein
MNEHQAKELKSSSLWTYICNELEFRRTAELNRLVTCDRDEIDMVRTRINVYDEIKNLPETVIDREEV